MPREKLVFHTQWAAVPLLLLFPSLLRCFVLVLTNFLSCDSIAFQTGLVSLSTSTRSQRSLATSSISSSLIIFVLRIREKLVDRPVAFPLLSTKQKKNLLHFLGKYLWHLQRAAILPAPVWSLSPLSALWLTVLYFGQSRRQLAVPQTVAGNPIGVW